jgi:2-haloacid dehalogenase
MYAPRACLFDLYGTLLDVHSAVGELSAGLGAKALPLSVLWRTKQLEYSWVESLMGRYHDFWRHTERALDYALAVHGIADAGLRADLLSAYRRLSPYPEVADVLAALRRRGIRTVAFSNGSPEMIRASLEGARLTGSIDDFASVHDVCIFKPAPEVYEHALKAQGVGVDDIAFCSSNRWDIAGAAARGWRTFWINRAGLPDEYETAANIVQLPSLVPVPGLLAA